LERSIGNVRFGSKAAINACRPDVRFTPLPTVKFLILQKRKTDPPLDSKIFRNRNAHLCRRGQNQRAGTGSIDDTPHPTTTFTPPAKAQPVW
jgi:hypothetical protein